MEIMNALRVGKKVRPENVFFSNEHCCINADLIQISRKLSGTSKVPIKKPNIFLLFLVRPLCLLFLVGDT
jgi:hypothetical protein